MSKIRLIPFKAEHLSMMNIRDADEALLNVSPDVAEFSSLFFEKLGMGFTAIAPEGIVGAAGMVKVVPGTYELWCYPTDLFSKYGIQVHRTAKRIFDSLYEQPNVRRVQCLVDVKNYIALRWAEALGLVRESKLRRYGPEGQDFIMFARVKKVNPQ